jgi:hypothetical protein
MSLLTRSTVNTLSFDGLLVPSRLKVFLVVHRFALESRAPALSHGSIPFGFGPRFCQDAIVRRYR